MSDTPNVSFTFSLFRGFVLVDAITENLDSHKYEVGNGSTVFHAFMARYSGKTFIQNIGIEFLYQKYISDYHHLQCPAAGPLVVQYRQGRFTRFEGKWITNPFLCISRVLALGK